MSGEVAERCLNHRLQGVEAVYNQHDYLDERRRALELYGLLAALERGEEYNVVTLRRAS